MAGTNEFAFFRCKSICTGGGVQNQAEKNSKNAFRPVPVQKFTFPGDRFFIRGWQQGGFQKRSFGRCSWTPKTGNWNEGTLPKPPFPCVSKQCPADGVWRIGRAGSPDRVLKTRFTPSESSAGDGLPPQRAPKQCPVNYVRRMLWGFVSRYGLLDTVKKHMALYRTALLFPLDSYTSSAGRCCPLCRSAPAEYKNPVPQGPWISHTAGAELQKGQHLRAPEVYKISLSSLQRQWVFPMKKRMSRFSKISKYTPAKMIT